MANFANPSFDTNLGSWNAGKKPSDLTTSLFFWYDISQETGYNDSDSLGTLTDFSGNSNSLTYVGSQGTYKTNQINGYPIIQMYNAPRFNKSSGITGMPSGDAELTWLLIFKQKTPASNDTIWNVGQDGAAVHLIYRTTGSNWSWDRFGSSNEVTYSATSDDSVYLLAGRKISSTRTAFFNGASGDTDANAINIAGTAIQVGDINANNLYPNIDFAELVMWTDNLADADFADIHSYLALKYGVTISARGAIITRDTGTKYAGAASMKVVTKDETRVFENVNPGSTATFTFTCYAYTTGAEVTSDDLELYYDTAAVTTTFSDMGSGWYKLTATFTGANAVKKCGVLVKDEKTVYLDSFDITSNANPAKPTNSTPIEGATDFLISGGTLTASAFSDTDVGDTHGSSIWQVANGTAFSTISWQSGWSTSQLTAATINATNGTYASGTSLGYDTTYYWKVSYADDKGGSSTYSDYTSFITAGSPAQSINWNSEPVKNIAKAIVDVSKKSKVSFVGTAPYFSGEDGMLTIDTLNKSLHFWSGTAWYKTAKQNGTIDMTLGTLGTVQAKVGTIGTVVGTVGTIATLSNTTFQGALGTFGTVIGTVGTVTTLTSTVGTFGDATNYTRIDGTTGVRLYGSATCWEDQMVDIGRLRTGPLGTAPAWGTSQGAEILQFEDGTINSVSFTSQIPHAAKVGGSVEYHLHTETNGTSSGSVVWQFTHSWAPINGSFPTQSTVLATQVITAGSPDAHRLVDIGYIGTNPGISSMMLCTLARIGTATEDSYGTVINLLQSDFHYEVDSMGSDAESSKT